MSGLMSEMAAKALKLNIPLERATGFDLSLQRALRPLLPRPRRSRRDDHRGNQGPSRPDGGCRSLLSHHQRRRDHDAQGFFRDPGARARADVLRKTQDQRSFDPQEGSASASARWAWNRCRSACIRIAPKCMTPLRRCPARSGRRSKRCVYCGRWACTSPWPMCSWSKTPKDYPGVRALANELGAQCTLDPTITPMMDGDRSILELNVDKAALREVFRDGALVGNVEEFCAPPQGVDEDALDMLPCSAGHTACYVSPYGDVYPCVRHSPTLHRSRWARYAIKSGSSNGSACDSPWSRRR